MLIDLGDARVESKLLEYFKQFYKNLLEADLSKLGEMYADNVIFKDPVHEIRGIVAVEDYFTHTTKNLDSCEFEFLDEIESENAAYYKWHMYFTHPRFGDHKITVRGVTHIQFDERIYYHEDIYDMGQMVYEHVPVLNFVVKKIKNKLKQ